MAHKKYDLSEALKKGKLTKAPYTEEKSMQIHHKFVDKFKNEE